MGLQRRLHSLVSTTVIETSVVTHTHTLTPTHPHTPTTHTHTRTHIHTYTYTHTHTSIQTYAHTHPYTRIFKSAYAEQPRPIIHHPTSRLPKKTLNFLAGSLGFTRRPTYVSRGLFHTKAVSHKVGFTLTQLHRLSSSVYSESAANQRPDKQESNKQLICTIFFVKI